MNQLQKGVSYALSSGLLLVTFATAINAEQRLDVVSVRQSAGGDSLPQLAFYPGRMEVAAFQLQGLVSLAFGISTATRRRQIEGWPDRRLPARRFTVFRDLRHRCCARCWPRSWA